MSEVQGTFRERNEAKRLDNEAARLRRGSIRGTLLPAVTWTVAIILCAASIRHFCIRDTIFDTAGSPADRDVFTDAQRDYYDGNLEAASAQVAKVLAKVPAHGPANQLMARIALARGDRTVAIDYLRRSLPGSVNREEVTKWIGALEALP